MAKATPAHIIYSTPNGEEKVIDFHAVISEEHNASSQITKYPVQTGKHISNHAIRQNRVVSLSGVFSNYVFSWSSRAMGQDLGVLPSRDMYGTDTNRVMFEVLESLVNSAAECKVVTNLGIYEPVIFNKFTTKQAAGKVDTLEFTISGEEIVKIGEASDKAPVPLNFTVIKGAEREATVFQLESMGINVGAEDEVSKVELEVGDDFTLSDVDTAGNAVKTTYIYKGRDPASGEPIYEVHLSEQSVEVVK